MLNWMLTLIVFFLAVVPGMEAGVLGGVIGLVVGLATASVFYIWTFAFFGLIDRCTEKWAPGAFDVPRCDKLDSLVLGYILFAVYFVGFLACCFCSCWLPPFLLHCVR
jgi:hypothetical protein